VHVNGETQLVGPVKSCPPHCAYCAAPPVGGGVVVGGGGVVVGVGGIVEGGTVVTGGDVTGGGFEEPLHEKRGGPGMV
jgi:hypothetical protein